MPQSDTSGYFAVSSGSVSTAERGGVAKAAAPRWFSSRRAVASRRNIVSLSLPVKRDTQYMSLIITCLPPCGITVHFIFPTTRDLSGLSMLAQRVAHCWPCAAMS